jgi:O-methyltransferase
MVPYAEQRAALHRAVLRVRLPVMNAISHPALKRLKSLWRLLQNTQYLRFRLASKLSSWICPEYIFTDYAKLYSKDQDVLQIYERFEGKKHYHSLERKYNLKQLIAPLLKLEGDSAECGAYKGATSYLICQAIQQAARQGVQSADKKRHLIFDSFQGVSEPGAQDGGFWRAGDMASPESVLRANLAEFPFVEIYPGWIPTRFVEASARSFFFVHIDVDLYQPTLDALSFFYPRLVSGGMMLFDDYGFLTCPGARQAVDQFLAEKPELLVRLSSGQAFFVKD